WLSPGNWPRPARECPSLWLRILKAEGVTGGTGDSPRIVFEDVLQVPLILRVADANGIRIRSERVERHRRDCVAMRSVKIHVLRKAIGVEEIVTRPAFGQIRKMRSVEIPGHFVAGAVDNV